MSHPGDRGGWLNIVIVGASLAGLRTAQGLRRAGHDGPIALIGAEPGLPYDRPPLSKQFLAGPRDTGLITDVGLAESRVTLRCPDPAISFDPDRREIILASGDTLGYDTLVVATGSTPRPRPPLLVAAGVPELRTRVDAEQIRDAMAAGARVAVVGAGSIGTEVAAAGRAHDLPVTLIDLAADPLARQLGPIAAGAVLDLHADRGVRLRPDCRVRHRTGTDLVLDDGTVVPADLVVVGVGVRPATDWLAGHGVDVQTGVPCAATGAAPWPDVWAVGDAAAWHTIDGHRAPPGEHWTNAVEQAAIVAHNLTHREAEWRSHEPVGYVWTDQYGHTVQRVGWSAPDDEETVVLGDPGGYRFVTVTTRADQVVAATAMAVPRRWPTCARRSARGARSPTCTTASPRSPRYEAGASRTAWPIALSWQPISCYALEAAMGFPDRIKRVVELAQPPATVWAALTTAEGLGAWFGNHATIDLRPGGTGLLTWDQGYTADLRIERVEEPTVFGYTWPVEGLPDGDPRRTYVEFTLEPIETGTRLTVVETGFAQLPDDDHCRAFSGNTEGWARELGELVDYLDAA
ncbi:MAG TPA: FAD-dependent oxidoreductase [Pseudonocardiaceae bacterium]|nr:FAD-dependent oxidoreductase [Pseudonocardiaceae bacterium]